MGLGIRLATPDAAAQQELRSLQSTAQPPLHRGLAFSITKPASWDQRSQKGRRDTRGKSQAQGSEMTSGGLGWGENGTLSKCTDGGDTSSLLPRGSWRTELGLDTIPTG